MFVPATSMPTDMRIFVSGLSHMVRGLLAGRAMREDSRKLKLPRSRPMRNVSGVVSLSGLQQGWTFCHLYVRMDRAHTRGNPER